MTSKSPLGENLTREWSEDPYAAELWDSLKQMEVDPAAGLSTLHELSEAGSPLSMMHLGHIYLTGQFGVTKNVGSGEDWLKRSADSGSIEGRYRLAKHLLVSGKQNESMYHFDALVDDGYSPAMFAVGYEYYEGKHLARDFAKSLLYLEKGRASGNLHAGVLLSHILIKHRKNVFARARGIWLRVKAIVPMIYYITNKPKSDRVRR
ncbi:hypothetical protein PIB19_06030 [Sphingomonas sp. 7/4-4]|uniref:tetratricopeptide repeat protein n=1 Tax=Sphingomonas sp. 7/4-4 TaxID=3018446 RepID=UPI0022F3BF63|nr:hypothetical protein [Sphingomonas sp. 7/4-4]WBY08953.1 hypothetical protein PIB19_06030 [Sphingomonas sp. 7/4-4]